ncbi:hypothetical protein BG452_10910 [Streptomyces sp. CBMA123]|nr:hypothetical protein [Streptomyces sp. CBMA123]
MPVSIRVKRKVSRSAMAAQSGAGEGLVPAGGLLDGGGPLQHHAVPLLRLPGRQLAHPPRRHTAHLARLSEQHVHRVLPLPLLLVLGHWLAHHRQDGHVRHAR